MSSSYRAAAANLEKFNRLQTQHENAFQYLWLPVVSPETPKPFFQETPIGLLRDLYPNIWRYGPRGDIYVAQIETLQRTFDTYAANPSAGGAFHLVHSYLPSFNGTLDLARYTHRQDIDRAVRNEQRPKYPFHFLDDQAKYPIFHALRFHPAFANTPMTNVPLGQMLVNFTYHSLYRDIIARYKSNASMLAAWDRYCEVFQFETC